MKTFNRDTAIQFPAMIVYDVDGNNEVPDLDPIVFMREDAHETGCYDGLLVDQASSRKAVDEVPL